MKIKKFKKYMKMKSKKHPKNTEWFKDFLEDKPTRRQFSKLLMGMTIMPDHFWYLSGRK